ncbi:MAG: hypothetical protein CBD76_03120 [Pelagibacteraceae bacterium TMED216]|nr:MAG: hypothetical protein CBD76_03120 [Pelagibacteraceae bacterium TMED216]|tara:strand:- start:11476 stop:13176 length:1701 start_codon:yes stop_codon:yes gene_type:complete
MIIYLKKLLKIFEKKERYYFLIVIFFAFVSAILEMIGIALIIPAVILLLESQVSKNINIIGYNIYDLVLYLKSFNPLIPLSFIVFGFLLKNILLFLISWFNAGVINKIGLRISRDILKTYFRKDYTFFLENSVSKLTFNNTEVVYRFNETLGFIFLFLSELLVLIAIATFMILIEPKGFFIGLSFILIASFFVLIIVRNKTTKYGTEIKKIDQDRFQQLSNSFGAIKEIKVLKKFIYFIDDYFYTTKKMVNKQISLSAINAIPRFFIESLFVITIVIFIFYLNFLQIPAGKIILILSISGVAALRLMPCFSRVLNSLQRIKYGYVYIDTIFDTLNQKLRENNDYENTYHSKEKKISFENIHYKFNDRSEEILENVNITINKLDFIGLIGKTGSGKSTFANLVLKLLYPSKGKIINNFQKISFVPQSPYLINGSIKDNIAFGLKEDQINNQLIKKCLIDSQLQEFVKVLDNGIETKIGDRGLAVSGGELQRIAIARALYSEPDLIIFDEATNALDKNTEQKIIKLIHNLSKKITIILITHDIKNINYCSKIFKINEKKIEQIEKNLN